MRYWRNKICMPAYAFSSMSKLPHIFLLVVIICQQPATYVENIRRDTNSFLVLSLYHNSHDEEDEYKVPLTPEEQQAAKEVLCKEQKANKKAVKEAQVEKRKTKIKKDKKKAIKKTKGNKGCKLIKL